MPSTWPQICAVHSSPLARMQRDLKRLSGQGGFHRRRRKKEKHTKTHHECDPSSVEAGLLKNVFLGTDQGKAPGVLNSHRQATLEELRCRMTELARSHDMPDATNSQGNELPQY
jgi:hypothetical protein